MVNTAARSDRALVKRRSAGYGHNDPLRSSGPNPTLATIEMVEDALKSDKTFSSKNELWRSLPRQVQYPTFVKVLNYLERSNKIIYDKEGNIIWTFVDSPEARKSLEESSPL